MISIPAMATSDEALRLTFDWLQQHRQGTQRRAYTCGKTARAFHASPAMIRMLRGCLGCGKTYSAFKEIYGRAVNMPLSPDGVAKTRAIVIRNRYTDIRRTTLKSFWDALPPSWAKVGRFNKSEHLFEVRAKVKRSDGSIAPMHLEVRFMALDRDNALAQFKGMEMNVLFCNEMSELNPRALQQGLTRLGRFPNDLPPAVRQSFVIADSNSFDPALPIYKFFYDKQTRINNARKAELPPERFLETFDYPGAFEPDAENIENVGLQYYRNIVASNTEQYVNVMVHNKFGAITEGRACYPSFVASYHAAEYVAARPELPLWAGIDFGLDPALVIFQEDEKGRTIVVDADFRFDTAGNVAFQEMFERMAHRYPPSVWKWVTGGHDPGGEARGQDSGISPAERVGVLSRDMGVCKTMKTNTNDPVPRIDIVETILSASVEGKPKFRISNDPSNAGLQWLIRAMTRYEYARKKISATLDEYQEVPRKNAESHIAEALQYGLLAPGSKTATVAKARQTSAAALTKTRAGIVNSADYSPF